ncbi:MAG: hypothetical protein CMN83_02340 [Spongiibacter sp.]|nr:hypothetical protein [Spongiibacter sp.]
MGRGQSYGEVYAPGQVHLLTKPTFLVGAHYAHFSLGYVLERGMGGRDSLRRRLALWQVASWGGEGIWEPLTSS